jgi:3'-phosphoadenosine 5'-phosphosulfate sulfotransferase (PAPS reductase)/FAD synthetase
MGIRLTDPRKQDKKTFMLSTEDWGQFMRVYPILDWNYKEIW